MKITLFKIEVDLKRLIITMIYLALFLFSIINAYFVRKDISAKNLLISGALVFFLLFVISLNKLLRKSLQKTAAKKMKNFLLKIFQDIKKLFSPVYRFLAKWVSKFFPDHGDRIRIHGQDKRSFIFSAKKQSRKQNRLKNTRKWIDQNNNSKRVRFIYTEFMLRKIKSGYFLKSSLTPGEISDIIATADEQTLFDIYQLVRYDDNVHISDETLKSLIKYAKKAKKL